MDHVHSQRHRCVMPLGKDKTMAVTPTNSSSAACIIGAAIIWIDLLICRIPGKSDFRIQDSNVFLACALSLSFGVMVSGTRLWFLMDS